MRTKSLFLIACVSLISGCLQPPDAGTDEAGLGRFPVVGPRQPNIPELLDTSVEVWNGWSYEWSKYQQESFVDSTSFDSRKWHFRYRNNQPNTASVVWQVMLTNPRTGSENWDTPAGLVGEQPATKGNWTDGPLTYFDIDFTKFKHTTVHKPKIGGASGFPKPKIGGLDNLPVAGNLPGGTGDVLTSRFSDLPPVDPVVLFVRVVPLDALGTPTGRPSRTVKVTYGLPAQPEQIVFQTLHPTVHLTHFTPPVPEAVDSGRHFIVNQDLPFANWHKGDHVYIGPKSSSWFDDLSDAVGSLLSYIKDAWNWIARNYNKLKADVIGFVDSNFCFGVSACESLVEAGVNGAMIACGVPPSLPDFDQLVAEGKDYLVSEMAAETGAPRELVEKGVDLLAEQAKNLRTTGGDVNALLYPDPAYQYQTARLTMTVTNTTATPIGIGEVMLSEVGTSLYNFRPLRFQPIPPGATVNIPVALEPKEDPLGWRTKMNDALDAAWKQYLVDSKLSNYFAATLAAYNQSVVDQAAWVSHYNTGWTVLKAETRLEGFSGGTLFQEQRFVSNAYPTTL